MSKDIPEGRSWPNSKQEFSSYTSRDRITFLTASGSHKHPCEKHPAPGKQRAAAAAPLQPSHLFSEAAVLPCSKNHRFISSACQLLADLPSKYTTHSMTLWQLLCHGHTLGSCYYSPSQLWQKLPREARRTGPVTLVGTGVCLGPPGVLHTPPLLIA